jgi:membrane-associated protease RseP (regulator of RpoE activity)
MSRISLRGAVEWALMVTLVLGVGAIAQAQNDQQQDEHIVKIGHADDQGQPNLPPPDDNIGPVNGLPQNGGLQNHAPQYWIGLLGGPIPPDHMLRAQVDLPENEGLLVQSVVPNSPASKAGLKQFDILVKANGKELHEMQDLVDLVASEGPKKGEIKLDVLRRGKTENLTITPEDRPANAAMPRPNMLGGAFGNQPFADPNDMLQQFRNFGPGVIVGGGNGISFGNGTGVALGNSLSSMPNGVSVSVQKENDRPAHITVKRGSDTWNIVGDDPESLKQLPDDLRPFVDNMVHNKMNIQVPNVHPNFGHPGFDNGQMQDQMQRLEQRLNEMQKQLDGPNKPSGDKSNDQAEPNN